MTRKIRVYPYAKKPQFATIIVALFQKRLTMYLSEQIKARDNLTIKG